MALNPNELFSTVERGDTQPRCVAEAIQPKDFAVGAGDATDELPVLTPLAFNTALNQWAPWDANGGNGLDRIRALLWPEAITLDADEEVIGNVLMRGKVHYDDLLAAVEERGVEVEADLLTELRTNSDLRELGILVYGLPQIR